jgi:hypothetical protein
MRAVGMLDVKTKFKTVDIISQLHEHRKNHIKEYENAMEVYREKVLGFTQLLIGAATNFSIEVKEGKDIDYNEVSKKWFNLTQLKVPVDSREMYDQLITLFASSDEETIEMSLQDANSIINDEWDWAISAKTINSTYSSSR